MRGVFGRFANRERPAGREIGSPEEPKQGFNICLSSDSARNSLSPGDVPLFPFFAELGIAKSQVLGERFAPGLDQSETASSAKSVRIDRGNLALQA